ncbi:hypothetical protein ACOSQ3_009957 [Xanthoceras sorbifolium]
MHIQNCKTSKEARKILQTTHEGTSTVNKSKIQMLTLKFESLRIEEEESFLGFQTKLMNIMNLSVVLGKHYSGFKIIRKSFLVFQTSSWTSRTRVLYLVSVTLTLTLLERSYTFCLTGSKPRSLLLKKAKM